MCKLNKIKIDYHNWLFDNYGIDRLQREIEQQMEVADYQPSRLLELSCRDVYDEKRTFLNSSGLNITEEDIIDVLMSL